MAQPGTISRGFGGRVLTVTEATHGTTPTNPAFLKISDHIKSVSLSLDPQFKEYRDIGDYTIASFVAGLPMYGLKVSFLLHTNRKTPIDDAIVRSAANALPSYTIEVMANGDDASQTFYTFTGCKADDVQVKGEVGGPIMVEITYKALAVATATAAPSVGSGSRESAALGALCVFATSTVKRGGSSLAYVTRNAEFRVSNALEPLGTDGQTGPKMVIEGVQTITGKADITIDDGGKTLWDTVLAGTAASVVFALGTTGAPQYTIANAIWESLEVPIDAEQGFIKSGVGFKAKSLTVGTVP